MAKFYVSSTYNDLQVYRAEVYHTLRRMGHDAIAMEDYVAADERPLARCLDDVERSDGYIGIVAWRRGFVPTHGNPEGRSITELEYSKAGDSNLPRLMFLLSPAAPWPSEDRSSPADAARYDLSVESFRARLTEDHLVSFFETPHQLALLVSIAVRKWEIDSGYTTTPPSLSDQRLPEELRVESYVPGKELRLFYDEPLGARILKWGFLALWFALPVYGIVAALFPGSASFADLGDLSSAGALALFAIFGAWIALRRRRIWFDFESGHVTIQGLGGFEVARPMAGVLTLETEENKRGWRSSVRYGSYTLLTTDFFSSHEDARARVLNFARALNFQLGMHTLDEQVKRKGDRRTVVSSQQRAADASHWWPCLIGAGTVFLPIVGYNSVPALFDSAQSMSLRLERVGWSMLPALAGTLFAGVFAVGMLQGTHRVERTRARAFALGIGMAGGMLVLAILANR